MFNQRKQINLIILLCICLIFISSCQENTHNSSNKGNSQKNSIKINRFEEDLFSINQQEMSLSLDSLQKKYGSFYSIYFGQIMHFGDPKGKNFQPILVDFINHPDLKELAKDVRVTFPTMVETEKELAQFFDKYLTMFPKDSIPKICTFISGFNNAIITSPNYVGIGLDMFMGQSYRFYPTVNFPDYITRRLSKEYILPSVTKAILSAKFEQKMDDQTFLDEIIYQGKLHYMMSELLPEVNDSLIIGYSKSQLNWCIENESNILKLFVEEEILFSSNQLKYKKYLDEAPFTSGLANSSAPRIGIWCGWQIIEKYMSKFPETKIEELMKEEDAQKILKLSQYKP